MRRWGEDDERDLLVILGVVLALSIGFLFALAALAERLLG